MWIGSPSRGRGRVRAWDGGGLEATNSQGVGQPVQVAPRQWKPWGD
uniref:Uncharacterized protein n=1 Tax=Arundo donax TaxID=35708 RepID=A0A0A8XUN4_ARUDO